jgi:hypothetical protein
MSSQYYSVTAYVGTPHRNAVEVTIPLVGPAGPQGPAGTAGASAWSDITGKPATFPPSTHAAAHKLGGSDVLELDSQQILVDSVFLSSSVPNIAGVYLHVGRDNGKGIYENAEYRSYFWWDSDLSKWFLANSSDVNLFESSQDTLFPWQSSPWTPISPQMGTIDVHQAQLFDISDQSVNNPSLLRTPKSGNATSNELVLGSDTRLTNARTPTTHASTHHTGGSDALTPASISAAPAVTVIELTPSPGSTTITTSQLPARGIAYIEGGGSFTVNLPTPDKRQSGLTFSIKVEHEGASGDVFITVVHNASDLLTSYELDEDESSLDFLWDGYRWTYSSANWLYSYPNRRLVIPPLSGTIALNPMTTAGDLFVGGTSGAPARLALGTASQQLRVNSGATALEYFTPAAAFDPASPGAIGSTTPAAGTFTTLTAAPSSGSALTLTGGTVTASAPLISATQTWNSSGTTFTGFRLNATNTASATASLLADFQVGGTSVANIRRDGRVLATSFGLVSGAVSGTGFAYQSATGDGGHIQCFNNAGSQIFTATNLMFRCSGDLSLGRSAAAGQNPDTILVRDDAGVLAQRNAANAQEFRVYGTYTSSTNYQRLTIKTKAVTLATSSGASVATTTGFIPDGAVLVGLTTRVSTAITGATGYDIGDGSDADRWGANINIALNTASDNRDWTATTIQCFTAAQEVTLTAVGPNFTGGAVVIVAHYLAGEAD